MMAWAFLIMVAVYLGYSMWLNRSAEDPLFQRSKIKTYLVQGPLFVLACVLGWRAGVFGRELVSVYYLGAGLLIGHLIFGISLLSTHRKIGDTLRVLLDLPSLWAFAVETPGLLFRFLLVSFSEELIYRVALQSTLIEMAPSSSYGVTFAVGITALSFSVVHWHFFRNRILDSVEFAGFAVLLGLLYMWTQSLLLVVVIHTLRNLEIVYLEYMRQLIERGDAQSAMEAIEAHYTRRVVNES
ncbi:MAG: CPBP family intramembrane metalloprotease [Candidatus Hydrogenedentes bacterium]|nr:CPBP family intramembrane metalloprotease [Candidatus Hydrogenedentota bacterium]